MNWYKQAKQEEWSWKRFVAAFGMTTILGLAALWGMDVLSLQRTFQNDPQKVIQEASRVKKEQLTDVNFSGFKIPEEIPEESYEEEPIKKEIPEKEIPKQNISIDLSKIHQIESSRGKNMWNETSRARGHFQFLEKTWNDLIKRMGKNWDWWTDSMDYDKSKKVADFYLNYRIPQMLNYYNIPDTTETRLASYNWGVGSLNKAWKQFGKNWIDYAPQETKGYIAKYGG